MSKNTVRTHNKFRKKDDSESLESINQKILLREFKESHDFITRYFNCLNEFINTHGPTQHTVAIFGQGKTEFIHRKDGENTARRVAIFLSDLRYSLEMHRAQENILPLIYALKNLQYWNQSYLRSDLLARNLTDFFESLNKDLGINADAYSRKQLRIKYGAQLKSVISHKERLTEQQELGSCNYHACKVQAKLFQCDFCHDYFCTKHKLPFPPRVGTPTSLPDGHPCAPYVDYQTNLDRTEKETYAEALKRFLGGKSVKSEKQDAPIGPRNPDTPPKQPATGHKASAGKKLAKLLKRLWPLWILFIIVGALFYASTATVKEVRQEPKLQITTYEYNETVADHITFKEYLENIYDVEGTQAVFKGFLKRYIQGTETTGIYIQSIVDDNNNTIRLTNLTDEQRKMFPPRGISDKLYEVTGRFKREYKTLILEVQSIAPSERTLAHQVTKTKTEEVSQNMTREEITPRYPLVRSIVFDLLGKEVHCADGTVLKKCASNKPNYCSYGGIVPDPTTCGCPEGQRAYQGECIREVKCSDGTLQPDCSKSQPKQCVDGNLVDNADLCGCPSDYKQAGNSCKKILRCSDGTIYGECSSNKPLACSAGNLVKDAELCGCDWGYKSHNGECIDSAKAEAMDALDHVNDLRAQYGRPALRWNEQLYQLALFRAKDMYDRKYFDHVTPDGQCVKDFKARYGLSQYNIAENAAATTYGGVEGSIDYASYANPTEKVDGWMESRGHRYNLLYPAHTLGAVSCYHGACIFLGANTEPYGLGALDQCTTGEQGLSYWKTASQQPNEV